MTPTPGPDAPRPVRPPRPPWWRRMPAPPRLAGGHRVRLLRGGDELFPAMVAAIDAARRQVWLSTYLVHDDPVAWRVVDALAAAARRGVRVGVVVDGFGTKPSALARLRETLEVAGAGVTVFRPVGRWWHVLMSPGQLRRLHHKLCAVDADVGFVGGVNLIDDRIDIHHGRTELPRLDFAVELHGPVVASIEATVRALWSRAALGARWTDEIVGLIGVAEPFARLRALAARLRLPAAVRRGDADAAAASLAPVRAMLLVRDNVGQRRVIERAYLGAIRRARERIDIVSPYFYPGSAFRAELRRAARRGVQVRLVLQGKIDYRVAGLAAQVLYDELLGAGVRIFEYVPAFLHAKVAVVDGDWATVGSSNIDPLSLLLNLEANAVVRDAAFGAELARCIDEAIAVSREVRSAPVAAGLRAGLRRTAVAWVAGWLLRLAGYMRRY